MSHSNQIFAPPFASIFHLYKYFLALQLVQHPTFIIFCRYFSYEHFYVIYCKFWELDTDHDFFIDKENLIKYGNHALTYRIVDRIFSEVGILILLPISDCSSFFSFSVFSYTRWFFKMNFALNFFN